MYVWRYENRSSIQHIFCCRYSTNLEGSLSQYLSSWIQANIYMLAIYINSVLGKHRQSPGAESDSSIAPNISHQIASEINPWLNIDIFGLFGYHYSREAWKNNMLIYIRAFKVSGRERLKENLWAIWVDYSMVCNMNQDAVHLSKLHPQILS